jgi:hypothetical protein
MEGQGGGQTQGVADQKKSFSVGIFEVGLKTLPRERWGQLLECRLVVIRNERRELEAKTKWFSCSENWRPRVPRCH